MNLANAAERVTPGKPGETVKTYKPLQSRQRCDVMCWAQPNPLHSAIS
jgi:hypothetical protein